MTWARWMTLVWMLFALIAMAAGGGGIAFYSALVIAHIWFAVGALERR